MSQFSFFFLVAAFACAIQFSHVFALFLHVFRPDVFATCFCDCSLRDGKQILVRSSDLIQTMEPENLIGQTRRESRRAHASECLFQSLRVSLRDKRAFFIFFFLFEGASPSRMQLLARRRLYRDLMTS